MKMGKSWLAVLLLVAFVVSACGAAAPAPTPEPAMDKEVMSEEGSADKAMDDSAGDMPAGDMPAGDDMSGDDSMDNSAGDDMSGDDNMDKAIDNSAGDDMSGDDNMDKTMDNSAGDDMSGDDNMDKTMDNSAGDDMAGDDSMDKAMDDSEAMMDLPDWFSAQLTDVNSGQAVSVSGLAGKVILVETMAIWCSNCLRQQQEVQALHEALGERDDLVTLVLDIDANEAAGDLQAYTARHGFPWIYAVAPREVAREIGQLYGDQFLNPPSTPMLIVDRHGEVHPLPFGRKTAGDLQEALAPFLDGEM